VRNKKNSIALYLFSSFLALALAATSSYAVNERYHPRKMDEANILISQYEVEIARGNATADNYAGLIEGLKKRREAYFNRADGVEVESKIFEAYRGLLKVDPNNYQAGVSVIEYEVALGRIDGLQEKLETLVASNPGAYKCHLLKGRLLFYKADFDNSILEITKGISLKPANEVEDIVLYNKLLAAAGKFAQVMKKSPLGPSGEPVTAAACANIAAVYLDREVSKYPGNVDRAIELLNKCLDKDKTYVRAYIMMAQAYGDHKKNYKEAMNCIKKLENIPCESALLKQARNLNQKYFRLSTAAATKKK